MPKTEVYEVTILWTEETKESSFVRLTKGQAEFMEQRLKKASDDKRIHGFSLVPIEPATTYQEIVNWFQRNGLDRYFGPKEWAPSRVEKELPFIEISDGRLICTQCGAGGDLAFEADEAGAEELGNELANRKIGKWLYSSSVDFPGDYGAPELNFRSIIETAAGLDVSEDRPW